MKIHNHLAVPASIVGRLLLFLASGIKVIYLASNDMCFKQLGLLSIDCLIENF